MNAPFNPYAAWLGLPVSTRSPSHYELLGVSPNESSAEAISQAADGATSKVRAIRPGANASEWAQLLDELAAAKATLLDPAQRAAYDSQRTAASQSPAAGPFESLPQATQTPGAPPQSTTHGAGAAANSLEMAVEVAQPSQAETASKYPPGFLPPSAAATGAAIPMNPAESAPQAAGPMAPMQTGASAQPTGQTPQSPAPYAPSNPNLGAPISPAPQPTGIQPAPTQSMPAQQVPVQPLPGQPQPGQPLSGQPQPGQATPGPQAVPAADPMSPMPIAPGMPPQYPGGQIPAEVATPVSPQTSNPVAAPVTPLASHAPAGYPAVAQAVGATPMQQDQAAPIPIPMGAATNVQPASAAGYGAAVPVGQAVQAQDGQTPMAVGANKSASKEASRRRKQAWMGPLTVLAGALILAVLAGAIYFGLNGRQVANSDGETGTTSADPQNPGGATGAAGSKPSQTGSTAKATSNPTNTGIATSDASASSNVAGHNGQPNNADPNSGQVPENRVAANNPPPVPTKEPNTTKSPSVVPFVPIDAEQTGAKTTTNSVKPNDATAKPAAVDGPEGADVPQANNPNGTSTSSASPNNPANPASSANEPAIPNKNPAGTNATPTPQPTKKEVEAFRNAMLAAYDSTCLHDFAAVKKHLSEAKANAKTNAHREMRQRLEEVADYVEQYRTALEKATSELGSGTVFQVGEFTVAVVETGKDYIKIRAAGQTRHYKLNVLPGNTGLAIGDLALDQLAASTKVFKGAYLLAHPRVDATQLAKARKLWAEALQEGADIKHLMAALDDDYAAIK